MFLEALPGRSMPEPIPDSIPEQYRTKLFTQFADFQIQLSRIRFPKVGSVLQTPDEASSGSRIDTLFESFTSDYRAMVLETDDVEEWFIR